MAPGRKSSSSPTRRPQSRTHSQGKKVPASKRYTPPIPASRRKSPTWMLVLIFGTLGLGVLSILLDYLGVLPGGASNWYLLGGLALLAVGFASATKYH